MSLIEFKSLSALLILIITILSGLLTLRLTNSKQRILQIADACANGIFIGAALFHLLPDAFHHFAALNMPGYQLIIATVTLAGFFLLNFLEIFSIGRTDASYYRAARISTLMLVGILSIHSLVTGATLGIAGTLSASWIILVAIAAHKGCESFALISNMRRAHYNPVNLQFLLFSFSLVTPIGILLGSLAHAALQSYDSELVTAYFNAFAAGTFLYLGTKHSLHTNHHKQDSYSQWQHLLAGLSGMMAMGLIAVWV